MIKNFEYRTDGVYVQPQQVRSIKIQYKLAMKSDGPLILYSAKFYYKIANFLLKPGTPNGQQKKWKEGIW